MYRCNGCIQPLIRNNLLFPYQIEQTFQCIDHCITTMFDEFILYAIHSCCFTCYTYSHCFTYFLPCYFFVVPSCSMYVLLKKRERALLSSPSVSLPSPPPSPPSLPLHSLLLLLSFSLSSFSSFSL